MVIVGGMLRLLLLGSHHPRGRALLSVLGIALGVALAKGDRLRLIVGHRTVELQVGGVVDLKGVEALTDIATAQWRLERLGQLNRLDVRLKRGADREAVRLRIAALLPPGVHVAPVQALEQASSYPSRAYRVNLDVLAMVALFTGGFLVFSAQALQVARRRGEHALLRVLGLRRRGVLQLVLLEAAALGAIGALAGAGLHPGWRRAGAARTDRRAADLWLRRHRLPAHRQHRAHAEALAGGVRRAASAALARPRARAGPAARRTGAGGRKPRRDRRQLLADGRDGDHGRVVPAVGR